MRCRRDDPLSVGRLRWQKESELFWREHVGGAHLRVDHSRFRSVQWSSSRWQYGCDLSGKSKRPTEGWQLLRKWWAEKEERLERAVYFHFPVPGCWKWGFGAIGLFCINNSTVYEKGSGKYTRHSDASDRAIRLITTEWVSVNKINGTKYHPSIQRNGVAKQSPTSGISMKPNLQD